MLIAKLSIIKTSGTRDGTRISDSGAKKILTIRLYMLDEIMYLGTSLNATISFTWIRSRKEMTTFVLD
jgi:hypothetical protein